jgi:hypothetical protein
VAIDAIVLVPIGLLLLTDLPVILELSDRRAGTSARTVRALLWLTGNAGGLVVALARRAARASSDAGVPRSRGGEPVCDAARVGAVHGVGGSRGEFGGAGVHAA